MFTHKRKSWGGMFAQMCLTLCKPRDYSPPGSSVHGNSPGKNTGVGCHAVLQGNVPNPGIEPRSPALQVDSLPSEPPGKPKNTGVGSGNLPDPEIKLGLLHCRLILYQLSLVGKPILVSDEQHNDSIFVYTVK